MKAFYNEIDRFCCDWLQNLMDAGLITPGKIDDRSIHDVRPDDVAGFERVHFFAGIGGWEHAFNLVGWRGPGWSASLPCQPYSVGSVAHGGAKGQRDDRHLLPVFTPLVAKCRPPIIFGEQVASALKWGWLDEAFGALEDCDYACAAAIVPALAAGARHERKRICWVAHASGQGRSGHQQIQRISLAEAEAFAIYGDPLAGARRALDGDFSGLLPCDGLSVVMERHAVKGFGNAIVPPLVAAFIRSAAEAMNV